MADILVVDDDDVIRDTLCSASCYRRTIPVKRQTPQKKRWRSWKRKGSTLC